LVDIGKQEKIGRITALILPENYVMQRVFRKAGFEVEYDRFNEAMRAEINLRPDAELVQALKRSSQRKISSD
jgi:RimJ/RimL family protein N-acetyltransferase